MHILQQRPTLGQAVIVIMFLWLLNSNWNFKKPKAENIKFELALLKFNHTLQEKYAVAVQNKFEVFREA